MTKYIYCIDNTMLNGYDIDVETYNNVLVCVEQSNMQYVVINT